MKAKEVNKPTYFKQIPNDYEQLFYLKDIENWQKGIKKYITRLVELQGHYSCMLEGKKTVIVA